ncbi:MULTISPECIES: fatty acid desaturase [unclassified Roseovarius]|uniref:fatty acid desaturase n=1 Tax=unclassified Roseovarius TaxID=2614913 RepID=UPI000322F35B|nr:MULTISPECIES: fatty acid desaturase [unclassified Roseovarius]KJS42543.1 MAG: fatty acid desaturase [Roseovarius sp. BRH_c41]
MDKTPVEWPTLGLLMACYGAWIIGTTWAAALWLPLGLIITGLAIALHSSLCHEALHGHPFRSQRLNEALVFPCLCLMIPYGRFRDTHLAHHREEYLTDPYDDPEANYLDPTVWARLPLWVRAVLRINNTLAGRMLIGPMVAQAIFLRADWQAIKQGNRAVLHAWLWHIPAVALVLIWLSFASMPVWAYLLAVWLGLAVLKIRTFLEHRAHERASGRTVVIEDRGPLAWIFLNNNLHVVHHMHPEVPWYRLPALYAARRDHYLRRNDGYVYRSYAQIFRAHFWRAKDPVPHPLRPGQ